MQRSLNPKLPRHLSQKVVKGDGVVEWSKLRRLRDRKAEGSGGGQRGAGSVRSGNDDGVGASRGGVGVGRRRHRCGGAVVRGGGGAATREAEAREGEDDHQAQRNTYAEQTGATPDAEEEQQSGHGHRKRTPPETCFNRGVVPVVQLPEVVLVVTVRVDVATAPALVIVTGVAERQMLRGEVVDPLVNVKFTIPT